MALELRNRLNKTLGCAIAISVLLDYPTVERLAKFLLELVYSLDDPTSSAGGGSNSLNEINGAAQVSWHEGEL